MSEKKKPAIGSSKKPNGKPNSKLKIGVDKGEGKSVQQNAMIIPVFVPYPVYIERERIPAPIIPAFEPPYGPVYPWQGPGWWQLPKVTCNANTNRLGEAPDGVRFFDSRGM